MRLLTSLAVASFIAAFGQTIGAQRFEPLPVCRNCVSRFRILSPALGIDIEPSYMTAAVRFHNGTVRNLAKIDGSPSYRHVMRNLLTTSAQEDESFEYSSGRQPEQQKLELRSPSAGHDGLQIISSALASLQEAIAPMLPSPLPPALITYPNGPGLTYEIMQTAISMADIELVGDQRVAPVGAAAAANDLGLCQNFIDLDACEAEEAAMPMTRVLAVEYTKAQLTVTLSPFQASSKGYDWISQREWDLGADAQPQGHDNVLKEAYWRRVREAIQKIPSSTPPERPVTDVIVMGESALDQTFLDVMQDALKDVLPNKMIQSRRHSLVDPSFAAARGAAEFGKRSMESPDGCRELAVCRWWRKLIG